MSFSPEAVADLLSTGDGGSQVPQRGGDSQTGALQDDVIAGRVSDAAVQTQQEGQVLTVTQQLVPQVRFCSQGGKHRLRGKEWKTNQLLGVEEAGLALTWCVQVSGQAVFGDHLQVLMLR